MTASPAPSLTPRELANLLWNNRLIWLGTTAVCGALAVAFALVAPRYWEASQALVIRQETAGASSPRPGKFADLYEMKTLQETILELAKSRQVVADTLTAVDRQLTGAEPAPPTDQDVEKFRKRMQMLPPDGAEFGKTEVFYFNVKDTSRERAVLLVGELCRQLDAGLKQLRTHRASGLIAELEEEIALTSKAHERETKSLSEFESKVGADLGELRMLQSGSSGQSDLRQEVVQLGREMRQFQVQLRQADKLLSLLKAAEDDPLELVATPNTLLASQPALRRLKDGLLDAQIATAKLIGTRSPDHPRVKAAIDAEKQIRADLHRELVVAIRGAEIDLEMCTQRYTAAKRRTAELEAKLSNLADLRAEYSNRVAAVENSRLSLDRARQSLATARAGEAAAHSGSLVTRIDKPETGPYPVGPGRTVIAGAGAVGGLMLGLGWLFLTLAPTPRNDDAPRRGVSPAAVKPTVAPVLPVEPVTNWRPVIVVEEIADDNATPEPSAAADEWWNAVAASAAAPSVASEVYPSVSAPEAEPAPVVDADDATAAVQTSATSWPADMPAWPGAEIALDEREVATKVPPSWSAEAPPASFESSPAATDSFALPVDAPFSFLASTDDAEEDEHVSAAAEPFDTAFASTTATLPRTVGVLPAVDSGFGGMSLEDALAVATVGRS